MKDFVRKSLNLGLGLAVTSKEQIESTVEELVKKGEVKPGESKQMVEQLVEKGDEERGKLQSMIREQVNQVLGEFNIATDEETQALKDRVTELEERVKTLESKLEETE